MNIETLNKKLNEKTLLLAWLMTLACWANAALVMMYSPFTVLKVSALIFAILITQGTLYLTRQLGKKNQVIGSIYKCLFECQ
ncbi:hypothetical protein [Pseudoalteromonas luteoviolacea]|uniref:Uncharacterized protein n=1 Tax=Pseudoalteromonas luteoviolacea NCIMB 1942 TaxID=1365253 RepID=A0A166ZDM7_9GAMM|nr:hypothetical protein [Pseudoalteromonas luteoviolacea]KZN44202.1 hypothetical protein N482_17560 [Pseudoalteromonas luteoviolacea NCIMB 1942]KZX00982.1 hypothetical protein JL49_08345 [Pseudoalteromonas luteoviolacea]